MKTKTLIVALGLMLFGFQLVVAQTSVVKLNSVEAQRAVDPSANAMNTIFLKLNVTNPNLLTEIQIELLDRMPMDNLYLHFPVFIKEGKLYLKDNEVDFLIENNEFDLVLPVRDQFQKPYEKLKVIGIDLNGQSTNQIEYIFQ
jgi:hypothetical protein